KPGRWLVRIASVVRGIVVSEVHAQFGAFGKKDGPGETEIALPIEIPFGNAQEGLACAVGQLRKRFEPVAQVMGMRQHGEQVDIEGQFEGFLHLVIRGASRDVDVVYLQGELGWSVGGQAIREIEADAGLTGSRFAARLKMHEKYQAPARRQFPRKTLRRQGRASSRLPAQKMARGTKGRGGNGHAGESWTRLLCVPLAAFVGAIKTDERVMHCFARRTQFEAPHLPRGLGWHGNDKVSVNVPAFGRQGVGL